MTQTESSKQAQTTVAISLPMRCCREMAKSHLLVWVRPCTHKGISLAIRGNIHVTPTLQLRRWSISCLRQSLLSKRLLYGWPGSNPVQEGDESWPSAHVDLVNFRP